MHYIFYFRCIWIDLPILSTWIHIHNALADSQNGSSLGLKNLKIPRLKCDIDWAMSPIRLMLNNLELWHRSYQSFYQLQIDYNIDTWRGTGTTACLHTEEVSLQSHKSVSGFSNYLIQILRTKQVLRCHPGCRPKAQLSLTTQWTTIDVSKGTYWLYAQWNTGLNTV